MVHRDRVFREPVMGRSQFVFDDQVASVFDDMISRSVPLYADVQCLLPRLALRLAHDPLRVVDLGCSTGTSLISIGTNITDRAIELTGVDNSAAMLEQCRQRLQTAGLEPAVRLHWADLREAEFAHASMVLMNYTLQFVPPDQRPALLERIRERIDPGGVLVLSEKVHDPDPARDRLWVELYYQFKRDQGYSELEIARKRDALENVLVTRTLDENNQMLVDAGFSDIRVVLRWFNFVTIVATV